MWVPNCFQNVIRVFINKPAVYALLAKMPFYAVAKGRSVGIFETWAECEAQVKGFSGARYKKFDSASNAKDFIVTAGAASYGPKTKPTQNFAQNTVSAPYLNNKQSFTTSSSSRTNGNSSGSKRRAKSLASQESTESDDDSYFDDGLDKILNKQMDDIEKRLKSFEKGVDKIEKKRTKSAPRAAIMIEPPQPKKARKSNNEFEMGNDGYVQVYTDGACSANGRSAAKAGIGVYWGDDHHLNISEPVSGRATNNCGEIQAATRAIKQAVDNGIENLAINTDSQFLINAVTKWMSGWKRKGWKLASGEPVKNEVDFKELDQVQNRLNIKWNYVEAHRGIYGNEKADQLAKAGAAMFQNCFPTAKLQFQCTCPNRIRTACHHAVGVQLQHAYCI